VPTSKMMLSGQTVPHWVGNAGGYFDNTVPAAGHNHAFTICGLSAGSTCTFQQTVVTIPNRSYSLSYQYLVVDGSSGCTMAVIFAGFLLDMFAIPSVQTPSVYVTRTASFFVTQGVGSLEFRQRCLGAAWANVAIDEVSFSGLVPAGHGCPA
jgi:hypothetical protein